MNKMGEDEILSLYVCAKCGREITSGENLISLSVNMGKLNKKHSVNNQNTSNVVCLCYDCASSILAGAVFKDKSLMPGVRDEEEDDDWYDDDDDNDEDDDDSDDDSEDDWDGEDEQEETEDENVNEYVEVQEYIPRIVNGEIKPFLTTKDMCNRIHYRLRSREALRIAKKRNVRENELEFIDPAEFHLELGIYYLRNQDWDHAVYSLSRFIELEPEEAYAYDKRGMAYGHLYRFEESLADFNTAISLNDEAPGFYNNRGLTYYKMSMFDEALTDYNMAINLDPEIAVFYANRGLVYRHKEEYEAALRDFEKAIELEPDLPETHGCRGEVYAILEEYEKAINDFNRELELNPNNLDVYASKVWAAEMIDNTRKARNSE